MAKHIEEDANRKKAAVALAEEKAQAAFVFSKKTAVLSEEGDAISDKSEIIPPSSTSSSTSILDVSAAGSALLSTKSNTPTSTPPSESAADEDSLHELGGSQVPAAEKMPDIQWGSSDPFEASDSAAAGAAVPLIDSEIKIPRSDDMLDRINVKFEGKLSRIVRKICAQFSNFYDFVRKESSGAEEEVAYLKAQVIKARDALKPLVKDIPDEYMTEYFKTCLKYNLTAFITLYYGLYPEAAEQDPDAYTRWKVKCLSITEFGGTAAEIFNPAKKSDEIVIPHSRSKLDKINFEYEGILGGGVRKLCAEFENFYIWVLRNSSLQEDNSEANKAKIVTIRDKLSPLVKDICDETMREYLKYCIKYNLDEFSIIYYGLYPEITSQDQDNEMYWHVQCTHFTSLGGTALEIFNDKDIG